MNTGTNKSSQTGRDRAARQGETERHGWGAGGPGAPRSDTQDRGTRHEQAPGRLVKGQRHSTWTRLKTRKLVWPIIKEGMQLDVSPAPQDLAEKAGYLVLVRHIEESREAL